MAAHVSRLDSNHRSALERAVSNILNTDLAITTYAQIIDGLPTELVAWDRGGHKLHAEHPINDHTELCPGVMERIISIKETFHVESLKLDPSLLDAFQSTAPRSQAFHLRLIELTAVAVHQIAVYLFQLGETLHDPASTNGADVETVTRWELAPDPEGFGVRVKPWPTLFTHPHFAAHEEYPEGIADAVGYWAEDRILGGVALFDRSQAWGGALEAGGQEPNAYFQSCRAKATWRVWQLLDDQQERLVGFLTSDASPSDDDGPGRQAGGPLPLMPSRANRVRVDPSDAVQVHKIYRDAWERGEPPELLRMQRYMTPCVIRTDDYPEMEDIDDQIRRINDMYR